MKGILSQRMFLFIYSFILSLIIKFNRFNWPFNPIILTLLILILCLFCKIWVKIFNLRFIIIWSQTKHINYKWKYVKHWINCGRVWTTVLSWANSWSAFTSFSRCTSRRCCLWMSLGSAGRCCFSYCRLSSNGGYGCGLRACRGRILNCIILLCWCTWSWNNCFNSWNRWRERRYI